MRSASLRSRGELQADPRQFQQASAERARLPSARLVPKSGVPAGGTRYALLVSGQDVDRLPHPLVCRRGQTSGRKTMAGTGQQDLSGVGHPLHRPCPRPGRRCSGRNDGELRRASYRRGLDPARRLCLLLPTLEEGSALRDCPFGFRAHTARLRGSPPRIFIRGRRQSASPQHWACPGGGEIRGTGQMVGRAEAASVGRSRTVGLRHQWYGSSGGRSGTSRCQKSASRTGS